MMDRLMAIAERTGWRILLVGGNQHCACRNREPHLPECSLVVAFRGQNRLQQFPGSISASNDQTLGLDTVCIRE